MTYVLSDIHGNLQRFRSVMEQIDLQPEDSLYVLGDVIDRFPDGIKILKTIMAMPNAHMLLGNHEHMMLEAITALENDNPWEGHRSLSLWYRNGGEVTHNYLKHIRKTVREDVMAYLRALPLNIDLEVGGLKFKLVHASPCENYRPYLGYKSLTDFAVWERWSVCDPVPEGYTMIFGHTPTINFSETNPVEIVCINENAIGIDCGAGYQNFGVKHLPVCRLGCLRLDDMKEFYSKEEIPT